MFLTSSTLALHCCKAHVKINSFDIQIVKISQEMDKCINEQSKFEFNKV